MYSICSSVWGCCSRAPQREGLEAIEMYSPCSSGGWQFQIHRWAGPRCSREESFLLSSSSGGASILGSWLTAVSLQSLSLWSQAVLPVCGCRHMVVSSSHEDSSHWMRAHPNDLISTSARTLFPQRSHLRVPGLGPECNFWGDTIQPLTPFFLSS